MKNRIKLISVIPLTVIMAFSMAACKNAEEKAKDDLQGTWKSAEAGIELKFSDSNVEWKASEGTSKGTFTVAGSLLTFVFKEGPLKDIPMAGQFEISGKTLTFINVKFTKQ